MKDIEINRDEVFIQDNSLFALIQGVEKELYPRLDSKTMEGMSLGFVVNGGEFYFENEKDAEEKARELGYLDWKDAYDSDETENYYTEWDAVQEFKEESEPTFYTANGEFKVNVINQPKVEIGQAIERFQKELGISFNKECGCYVYQGLPISNVRVTDKIVDALNGSKAINSEAQREQWTNVYNEVQKPKQELIQQNKRNNSRGLQG